MNPQQARARVAETFPQPIKGSIKLELMVVFAVLAAGETAE
jgi:hypothetical protein